MKHNKKSKELKKTKNIYWLLRENILPSLIDDENKTDCLKTGKNTKVKSNYVDKSKNKELSNNKE